MKDVGDNKTVIVLEPIKTNGNGHHAMTATSDLPIAKYVTNDQRIAEEKFLSSKEA